jgi:hypothetical protein
MRKHYQSEGLYDPHPWDLIRGHSHTPLELFDPTFPPWSFLKWWLRKACSYLLAQLCLMSKPRKATTVQKPSSSRQLEQRLRAVQ